MRDADFLVSRGVDASSSANQLTLPYEPAEVNTRKSAWLEIARADASLALGKAFDGLGFGGHVLSNR